MKAMIFAAGLGTRLKPFTLEHPKALVEVGGRPMLENAILRLKSIGVTEIVVNVHHFAEQIIDFINAHDYGVKISISDESELLLDTGGGLLKARQWLDGNEPFVVYNADIYTDLDLQSMIREHRDSGAMATLLVSERQTSRYLLMDDAMQMRGWINVNTGEVRGCDSLLAEKCLKLAFGGIHVISPRIFDYLERYGKDVFSIMNFYIDNCNEININGYLHPEHYHWFDIGKPESLAAANSYVNQD